MVFVEVKGRSCMYGITSFMNVFDVNVSSGAPKKTYVRCTFVEVRLGNSTYY